jgi:beta-mannosidase
MPLVKRFDGHLPRALHTGDAGGGAAWELAELPDGSADDPAALSARALDWIPAVVPGTVAAALAAAGRWTPDNQRDLDASDWWYRCRFAGDPGGDDDRALLRLDGLATIAEVWLNGERLLASDSMFHRHAVDVTGRLGRDNELHLRFRSLRRLCAARKGRPRWRTRLVEQQQLRWFRTTLLGRMPGWCPRAAPVGPFRGVTLERQRRVAIERAELQTRIEDRRGLVRASFAVRPLAGGARVAAARLVVGDHAATLEATPGPDGVVAYEGTLAIPDPPLWWPHTHGPQPLLPARLELSGDGAPVAADLGRLGFRTIALRTADDGFALEVNGAPIFCRGAVWTTGDLISLNPPAERLRALVTLARDAGMNMLRLGGTMTYETDAFHDLCDELGILVWQELMFANMDYPAEDPGFSASVRREVEALCDGLAGRPSTALFCGGSEVEQQAAMLGLPRERWSGPLFRELLPEALRARRPDVPYWPGSPSGGPMPFHVDRGLGHYYGVGAYLRPLEDARRAEVRFAGECLAFSNVPEPATVELVLRDGEAPPTHPAWKARVPRDRGVGWDFEDVRDHYVARLFGIDPFEVRYMDPERYLALGRVASGEVMARTFAEWRRRGSGCAGALVWTFQDVWPGAGWGVVDATGRPKAAWYHLRRALAPVALFLLDEGVNGLHVHAVNDGPEPVDGELAIALYRHGRVPVARGTAPLAVPPRDRVAVAAEALLERFMDTTQAYRFGPPGFDVVHAAFRDGRGGPPREAFHFPRGLPALPDPDLQLTATARRVREENGAWEVELVADRLALAVALDIPGFTADDGYLTLAPGAARTVRLRREGGGDAPPSGTAHALNGAGPVRIVLPTS